MHFSLQYICCSQLTHHLTFHPILLSLSLYSSSLQTSVLSFSYFFLVILLLILTCLSGIPYSCPFQLLTSGAVNISRVAFMDRSTLLRIQNAFYYSASNLSLLLAVSYHLRLDFDCMPAKWHLQLEPSNRKGEIGTWSIFSLSLKKTNLLFWWKENM